MVKKQKEILSEVRNSLEDLNLMESLTDMLGMVEGIAMPLSELNEAAALSNFSGKYPSLALAYFGIETASKLDVIGTSASIISEITDRAGSVLRAKQNRKIDQLQKLFALDNEIKTQKGTWKVYVGENQQKFLAIYSQNDSPKNLIAGEKYNEEILNTTIKTLTNKVIESDINLINRIFGVPDAQNGENWGINKAFILSILVLSADLGIGTSIEAYDSAVLWAHKNLSDWLDKGIMPWGLIVTTLATFLAVRLVLKTGGVLGKEIGVYRDKKITNSLDSAAFDYSYGKSALSQFNNQKLRDLATSVSGVVKKTISFFKFPKR